MVLRYYSVTVIRCLLHRYIIAIINATGSPGKQPLCEQAPHSSQPGFTQSCTRHKAYVAHGPWRTPRNVLGAPVGELPDG